MYVKDMFEVTIRSPLYVPSVIPPSHRNSMSQDNKDNSCGLIRINGSSSAGNIAHLNQNNTEGQVSIDINDSPSASQPTIDETAGERSSVQTPRPKNHTVKYIRSTQLFHYARMYRRLSTKGLLKLTIQEICKMVFLHKLLSRYVTKRRGNGSPNEFTLGSVEFELVDERQQSFLQRLHGYMYDWWASIFLKEDFGAVYYNDWRFVNIKVGR
jgi:hypothetical protein